MRVLHVAMALVILVPFGMRANSFFITGEVLFHRSNKKPIANLEISCSAGCNATLTNRDGEFLLEIPAHAKGPGDTVTVFFASSCTFDKGKIDLERPEGFRMVVTMSGKIPRLRVVFSEKGAEERYLKEQLTRLQVLHRKELARLQDSLKSLGTELSDYRAIESRLESRIRELNQVLNDDSQLRDQVIRISRRNTDFLDERERRLIEEWERDPGSGKLEEMADLSDVFNDLRGMNESICQMITERDAYLSVISLVNSFLFAQFRVGDCIANTEQAIQAMEPDACNFGVLVHLYASLGDYYMMMEFHDSAANEYREAIQLIEKKQHRFSGIDLGEMYCKLSECISEDRLAMFRKGEQLLLLEERQGSRQADSLLGLYYYEFADFYGTTGRQDTAFILLNNAKSRILRYFPEDHLLRGRLLNGFGSNYLMAGQTQLARQYFHKAESFFQEHSEYTFPHLAQTYFNLGMAYSREPDNPNLLQDARTAMHYLDDSYFLFREALGEDAYMLGVIWIERVEIAEMAALQEYEDVLQDAARFMHEYGDFFESASVSYVMGIAIYESMDADGLTDELLEWMIDDLHWMTGYVDDDFRCKDFQPFLSDYGSWLRQSWQNERERDYLDPIICARVMRQFACPDSSSFPFYCPDKIMKTWSWEELGKMYRQLHDDCGIVGEPWPVAPPDADDYRNFLVGCLHDDEVSGCQSLSSFLLIQALDMGSREEVAHPLFQYINQLIRAEDDDVAEYLPYLSSSRREEVLVMSRVDVISPEYRHWLEGVLVRQ